MFNRIVIVSEISPIIFDILRCLKGLKNLGTRECLLVQCLDPRETDSKISSYFTSIAEGSLEEQKKILVDQGYSVNKRVVFGYVKNEINRIAVEENFSMIVAGAPEHSMVGEVFLGGMSREVLQQARKPMLLVRILNDSHDESKETEECNILEHILFATDFSENAKKAFEYVKKMVADGVKRVSLVHVLDKSIIDPYLMHREKEFREIDEARLKALKEILQSIGNATVDVQLLYGSPSAEMIKFIEEQKISLVVMGTQGRGFIKQVFLGSVSHNIARRSAASVLLIPENREE